MTYKLRDNDLQNKQNQFMRTLSVDVDDQFQNEAGLNSTLASPKNASATKKEFSSSGQVPMWSYDYPVVAYARS